MKRFLPLFFGLVAAVSVTATALAQTDATNQWLNTPEADRDKSWFGQGKILARTEGLASAKAIADEMIDSMPSSADNMQPGQLASTLRSMHFVGFHEALNAGDGEDALAVARSQRDQQIARLPQWAQDHYYTEQHHTSSDWDFVRRLRAEGAISQATANSEALSLLESNEPAATWLHGYALSQLTGEAKATLLEQVLTHDAVGLVSEKPPKYQQFDVGSVLLDVWAAGDLDAKDAKKACKIAKARVLSRMTDVDAGSDEYAKLETWASKLATLHEQF